MRLQVGSMSWFKLRLNTVFSAAGLRLQTLLQEVWDADSTLMLLDLRFTALNKDQLS